MSVSKVTISLMWRWVMCSPNLQLLVAKDTESIKCRLYCIMMVFWSFFTYFFQIVFNRNHMWIRCKILISVQGECRRRGLNHCCGRGDWIGWEGRGAERGEFIWLPHPSYFLLLIHSVDIIGEISVRSRNCKK